MSQPQSSVSRPALGALFSVVFLDNLGFAIVLPYLFFYAAQLGASAFTYGILLAAYSLMSFIFTPIVARLSDRYGRRKILLAALAVASFSYFIFGIAGSLWVLFLGRMLSGTTAATVPVAQAYVADVTTQQNRLRYLGFLGAAAGIAFIMGPAIGGTLSGLFGYAVPSFLASALAFVNLVSTYFRLPEPEQFKNKHRSVISFAQLRKALLKKQIILLLGIYFLFFISFVFMEAALPPWLQTVFGFGAFQTGLVFFFIGGASAFTQAVALPKLSKRLSRSTLTLLGTSVFTVGLLVLTAAQSVAVLFLVVVVVAFGFGVQYVTLNTLISLSAPQEAQGGTLGTAWALAALAQTIGPVLAATTFAFGVSVGFSELVFMCSAAIAAASVPLVLLFRRLYKEN